ncbi:MAG: hypothetical protein K8S54_17995 [Spirochaetia bacterium]|nr:hypothetical protein [Spirochaetia bacterium]
MRVELFQISVNPDDISSNMSKIEACIAQSTADLLVFPEACTTGFPYRRLAEVSRLNSTFLDRILQKQKANPDDRSVIVLPLLIQDANRFYNRQFLISGGTIGATYDKIHLIGVLGEDRFLTAGENMVSTKTREFQAGLATCYDLRFPELFRKLVATGVNLFIIPAMWPMERASHLKILARARAIENLSYVIVCNATGRCGALTLCGDSIIVNPKGEVLGEAFAEEMQLTADLNLEIMQEWRTSFPVLNDMRLL